MVIFNPDNHTYTKNELRYISVTQLIKRYTPVYDSEYWSTYKAIKDVMESMGIFARYKQQAGGWENVVNHYLSTKEFSSHVTRFIESQIEERKQYYLDMWQKNKDDACEHGSEIHLKLQKEVMEKGVMHEGEPYPYSQSDILKVQDFESNGVYAELLVYNDEYRIAGQVDKVRKKGKKVFVSDYKTNKEITRIAFRNETLCPPLVLPNANYYIYNLQVSLYAWMLEQCGYEIEGLEIIHLRDEVTVYSMKYLKKEVTAMLNDYRNDDI